MEHSSDFLDVKQAIMFFLEKYQAKDLDGVMSCFDGVSNGCYVGSGNKEGGKGAESARNMMKRDFEETSKIECHFDDMWINVSPLGDSACCFLGGVVKYILSDGIEIAPVTRKTIYLNKINGQWLQVHSHISFPCWDQGENSIPVVGIKEKYNFLFSRTAEMVFFVKASDLLIKDANNSACTTLGYSSEDMTELFCTSLFDTSTGELIKNSLAENKRDIVVECEVLKSNGEKLEVSLSMDLFCVAGERCYLFILRDISDKKKQKKMLIHRLSFEELISSLSSKVFLKGDLDEVLDECVERLGVFVGADACYLFQFFIEEKTRSMTHCWTSDRASYELEKFQNLPNEEYIYFINRLKDGKPVLVDNPVKMSDHWGEEKAMLKRQTFLRSFIAIPFFVAGELAGYLGFDNLWESQDFSEDDLALLSIFSEVLGQAIAKIKSELKLRKTMEGSIEALSRIVEQRDLYTAGHQRKVSCLAVAIAEGLGLSKERVEGIRIAGLIHDLGKINIPAEILSKPGKLSDLEYRLVKKHPEIGYEILKNVEFPWPVADMVLQHHEKIDGSGYPYGLTGNDILFEAKILSVSDTVEAMTSHRPYRPSLGIDRAMEEILNNRGILYDMAVVDVCLSLREDGFFSEPPFNC